MRDPRASSPLPKKQFEELEFWREQIYSSYGEWYEGKFRHRYGIPAPSDRDQITQYGPVEKPSAPGAAADINKYPVHLLLPTDYFVGQKLLDVGCGPIPFTLLLLRDNVS